MFGVTCKKFQAQTTKMGGSATSTVAGVGGLVTGPSAPATQPPDGGRATVCFL